MSALNKLCLILILFEVFVLTAGSPWRVNLRARIFGKIVRLKIGIICICDRVFRFLLE